MGNRCDSVRIVLGCGEYFCLWGVEMICETYEGKMKSLAGKSILDMCCGSRMFWFDRADSRALFCDIRSESHILCDGRSLEVKPDIVADFRELPFDDEQFSLVVFDTPHLERAGVNGW